jgi:hypothetical protein
LGPTAVAQRSLRSRLMIKIVTKQDKSTGQRLVVVPHAPPTITWDAT